MNPELKSFLRRNDGIASVSEVADLLKLDEGQVRRWAREHSIRRIGATFVFGWKTTEALVQDLLPEECDDEERRADADDSEVETPIKHEECARLLSDIKLVLTAYGWRGE